MSAFFKQSARQRQAPEVVEGRSRLRPSVTELLVRSNPQRQAMAEKRAIHRRQFEILDLALREQKSIKRIASLWLGIGRNDHVTRLDSENRKADGVEIPNDIL